MRMKSLTSDWKVRVYFIRNLHSKDTWLLCLYPELEVNIWLVGRDLLMIWKRHCEPQVSASSTILALCKIPNSYLQKYLKNARHLLRLHLSQLLKKRERVVLSTPSVFCFQEKTGQFSHWHMYYWRCSLGLIGNTLTFVCIILFPLLGALQDWARTFFSHSPIVWLKSICYWWIYVPYSWSLSHVIK